MLRFRHRSTIGIDLDGWGIDPTDPSKSKGISAEDGAVFFMDPSHGATEEPVVFAQLSVPAGTVFTGSLSAQGRSVGEAEDWEANGLQYGNDPNMVITNAQQTGH